MEDWGSVLTNAGIKQIVKIIWRQKVLRVVIHILKGNLSGDHMVVSYNQRNNLTVSTASFENLDFFYKFEKSTYTKGSQGFNIWGYFFMNFRHRIFWLHIKNDNVGGR